MKSRQNIYEFMKARSLCVVSSLSESGQPQSAVVGFGQTEELQLVFGTSIQSRKAANIATNNNVSVVIGWDGEGTIQYEGVARQLEGEEAAKYSEVYFDKNPSARKYKDEANERYFLIEPKWLRFTDVTKKPWEVVELDF